jgi:hypothetical protein
MRKAASKSPSKASSKKSGVSDAAVRFRRIKRADGATIHVIDASRETFGDDLTLVFKRNVAEARRENKRLTGSRDRVPSKA